jgi:hypothetical protein
MGMALGIALFKSCLVCRTVPGSVFGFRLRFDLGGKSQGGLIDRVKLPVARVADFFGRDE